jgi:hypothetical protein
MTAIHGVVGIISVQAAAAAVTFVSLGDWGGAGISTNPSDYHRLNEYHVAKQLGKTMAAIDAKFLINTGDNFYYCGVHSVTDSLWKTDFEDVYTDEATFVPWYGVLGNHDYAYNWSAQFEYKSPNKDRWQLPSAYYTRRILLGGSQYATFIFIDTNPCIAKYRANEPSGWDPCSPDYASECIDPVSKKCNFHDHIMTQDCDAQFAWFHKELAAVNEHDWLFVVGHHEADQVDVQDFTGAMMSSNMRLYLNGHTHAMKHYQMDADSHVDFLTTGAGCMVYTKDQEVCSNPSCRTSDEASHTPKELFYKKVSAFSVHTFSEDFSSLKTDIVGTNGATIYSFVTQKVAGPGPSPSPPSPVPPSPPSPPAPKPSGSCSVYGCGRYDEKHSCQCNYYCKEHNDCCDDYDQTCSGPAPSPPSCKAYGCHISFNREHKCQCNRLCKFHGNCCDDYDQTCRNELVV